MVGSMQNNHPIPVVYIRYAHEFLFSLNVALVAKLEGNQEPNRLFSFFDSGEISLQSKINGFLHLHPHHAGGAKSLLFSTGVKSRQSQKRRRACWALGFLPVWPRAQR